MLSGISPLSIIVILVIVVLLFGTKKLRGLGGDLGGAIKSFKKAMKDESTDEDSQSAKVIEGEAKKDSCLLYTSPSPRDRG